MKRIKYVIMSLVLVFMSIISVFINGNIVEAAENEKLAYPIYIDLEGIDIASNASENPGANYKILIGYAIDQGNNKYYISPISRIYEGNGFRDNFDAGISYIPVNNSSIDIDNNESVGGIGYVTDYARFFSRFSEKVNEYMSGEFDVIYNTTTSEFNKYMPDTIKFKDDPSLYQIKKESVAVDLTSIRSSLEARKTKYNDMRHEASNVVLDRIIDQLRYVINKDTITKSDLITLKSIELDSVSDLYEAYNQREQAQNEIEDVYSNLIKKFNDSKNDKSIHFNVVGVKGQFDFMHGNYEGLPELLLNNYEYIDTEAFVNYNGNIILNLANNAVIKDRAFNLTMSTNRNNITINNLENVSYIGSLAFNYRNLTITTGTMGDNYYVFSKTPILAREAFTNVNLNKMTRSDATQPFILFFGDSDGSNLTDKKTYNLGYYGNNISVNNEGTGNGKKIIVRGLKVNVITIDNNDKKTTTVKNLTDGLKLDKVNLPLGTTFGGWEVLNRGFVSTGKVKEDGYTIGSILKDASDITYIDVEKPNQIVFRQLTNLESYKYTFNYLYSVKKYKSLHVNDTFKFEDIERPGYIFKGWREVKSVVESETNGLDDLEETPGDGTLEEIPEEILYAGGEEYRVSELGDKTFEPVFEFDTTKAYEDNTTVRVKEIVEVISKNVSHVSKKSKSILEAIATENANEDGQVDMNTLITAIEANTELNDYAKDQFINEAKKSYQEAKELEATNLIAEEAEAKAAEEEAKKKAEEEARLAEEEAKKKAEEEAAKKAEEEAKKNAVKPIVDDKPVKEEVNIKVGKPSVKNIKGNKIKVKCAKVEEATLYKIQLSTSKKFTKKTTKTYTSKKTSYTIKRLTPGKKYYVRVYVKVDGKEFYSPSKSVTIKK